MQIRHFIPLLFVLSVICTLVGGILWSPMLWGTGGIVASYAAVSAGFSIAIALRKDWRYAALLPLVFAILHISYGSGFLAGLIKFAPRWRNSEYAGSAASAAGH
jgi:hypothetical protein